VQLTYLSRRAFLSTAAAIGLVAASGVIVARADTEERKMKSSGGAFDYQHSPVPLKFDPKRLTGLSERLIQSHWENNYGGAVTALNTLRRGSRKPSTTRTPPPTSTTASSASS
jgi:Fe-Mn family superoxide dismutase